jgi:hypothetical protein
MVETSKHDKEDLLQDRKQIKKNGPLNCLVSLKIIRNTIDFFKSMQILTFIPNNVNLYIYLFSLSIHLSICLFALYMHLFIYLSICLFIYLSI